MGGIDYAELFRRQRLSQMLQDSSNSIADIPQPDISQPTVPQPPVNMGPMARDRMPAVPGPSARDIYAQFLQTPQPNISQYKPSLARRIIAPILGGIAGAGGYTQAGQQYLYAPFQRQAAQYQAERERLGSAAELEGTREKEKSALSEAQAKTEAEKQRAIAETARGERETVQRKSLEPGTPEAGEAEKKITLQHPPLSLEKDLVDLKLADGTTVKGARETIVNGELRYAAPDGRMINPGSIVSAQKQSSSQEKFTNGYQVAIREFQQTHGRLPTEEENTKIVKEQAEASGLFGQREAAANLAKARTAQIWDAVKPASQAEIAEAQMMNAKNPAEYWHYLEKQPPAMRRDLLLKVPPSAFLTGGQQDRIGNSNVALWHVDTLRDMIKDPFIKEHLGPILGRIDLANSTFGGDFIGGTPEEQEKEQQFLSFLTANLLWETTSGVGTRPARQTIELIKRTAPRASETEAQIKGALDSEEKSAKNIAKGLIGGAPDQVRKDKGSFSNIQEEQ